MKLWFTLIVVLFVGGCRATEGTQPVVTGVPDKELTIETTQTDPPQPSQTPTLTPTPTLTSTITPTPTITLTPSVTPTPDPYWFDDEHEFWPQEPLGREYYAFAWRGEERIPESNQTLQEAYTNGEAWAFDPIEIGLRFAGYPNIDDTIPEAVYVFYQGRNVVVVVRTGRVWDDSIFEQELRVDLVRDGDTWQIEWAGYRQRCARYAGPGDWVAAPCP